ncbi:MAG: glycosyltransferase family 2 protein [SAR86 cluster bacterium]|nr:glycosyltransferase family 2 protein [SAR86 cluster bacterium]
MSKTASKKHQVSIILPIFNAEKYLEQTIKSVLSQNYLFWELLCIDDCSTDGSPEIVKKFAQNDNRIRFFSTANNSGGPATPRNIGIKNARGKLICFLDADDIWKKSKLHTQIKEMRQYDFISTSYDVIDSEGKLIDSIDLAAKSFFMKLFFGKNFLIFSNTINTNSVMIVNKKLPDFNIKQNYIAIEDWIYWIELVKKGFKYKLINKRLIQYRVHNESISRRHTNDSYYKQISFLKSADFSGNNFIKAIGIIALRIKIVIRTITNLFFKLR